jgi:hypothetical protein
LRAAEKQIIEYKTMRVSKIVLVALSVALLAAGCSKSKNQTQTPPPPAETPAPPVELEGWIRFLPTPASTVNVLIPESWVIDSASTDNHFVLRSRDKADGSRAEDVLMEFTIAKMTARTVADQVVADTKDGKTPTKPASGTTDSGLAHSSLTFNDGKTGKLWSAYAIDLGRGQYMAVRVGGSLTHPYVGRIVQSVKAR